jgi:acyl carrier protein
MSSNIVDIKARNGSSTDGPSVLTEIVLKMAADIFGLNGADVDIALTPADCQTWDSLNHLRLITAFEKEFSCRLSMQQIRQIERLGDLVDIAKEKNAK